MLQLLHCCCLHLLLDRWEGVHHDKALSVSPDWLLSWLSELWTTATSNPHQTSKLCVVIRENSLPGVLALKSPDVVNSLFVTCVPSHALACLSFNPKLQQQQKTSLKFFYIFHCLEAKGSAACKHNPIPPAPVTLAGRSGSTLTASLLFSICSLWL